MSLVSLQSLAGSVPHGTVLALPPDNSLAPCEFVRTLVRRGIRDLHLVGVPVSGFATDLLIGAGCVASVQSSAVSLGEAGTAPCFVRAVAAGAIVMRDATCPAVHTMLQAAEKGVPFMPLRGVLGSDLLTHRPDWKVIDNPFALGGDPILLVPALSPDVAAFHAVLADAAGNVWVGRRRELATLAHASKRTLVTVERLVQGNLLEDEQMAPGTISAVYIEDVAVVERGAWPIGVLDEYGTDVGHVLEYARMARTEAGLAAYLEKYVWAGRTAAAE